MNIEKITSEDWFFIIERAETLPQGVHLWYKGCPYPRRVIHNANWQPNHFLRVLNALGTVKKFLFSYAYLKDLVIPYRLNMQRYERFLDRVYQLCWWNLGEFSLKDQEFSVPVWEMGQFIASFLQNLGLSPDLSKNLSWVVMMVLEFDCAYRYRLQDMVGLTTKELLQHPRSELKRILTIYRSREVFWVQEETGAKARLTKLDLLRQLLLLPKVKKAFLSALATVDLEKIKFDQNDRFHISFWKGYDFEGKTFEQRFTPFEQVFRDIPYQKRDDQNLINNFLLGL